MRRSGFRPKRNLNKCPFFHLALHEGAGTRNRATMTQQTLSMGGFNQYGKLIHLVEAITANVADPTIPPLLLHALRLVGSSTFQFDAFSDIP